MGATTMENSVNILEKLKLELQYTPWCLTEKKKNTSLKRLMHSMLIATLFTIAKI